MMVAHRMYVHWFVVEFRYGVYTEIPSNDIEVILLARKPLLYKDGTAWAKGQECTPQRDHGKL